MRVCLTSSLKPTRADPRRHDSHARSSAPAPQCAPCSGAHRISGLGVAHNAPNPHLRNGIPGYPTHPSNLPSVPSTRSGKALRPHPLALPSPPRLPPPSTRSPLLLSLPRRPNSGAPPIGRQDFPPLSGQNGGGGVSLNEGSSHCTTGICCFNGTRRGPISPIEPPPRPNSPTPFQRPKTRPRPPPSSPPSVAERIFV